MATKFFKYPSFVQNVRITPSKTCQNLRLRLEVNFTRQGDTVVVILKNPSQATTTQSDRTINNVLNYIHQNVTNIGKIVIYNLFTPYQTYSSQLNSIFKKVGYQKFSGGTRVNKLLQWDLKKSSMSIVAWGNHPAYLSKIYQDRILEVIDIINKTGHTNKVYYVGKISKKDYPLHAQTWGFNHSKYPLIPAQFNGYKTV